MDESRWIRIGIAIGIGIGRGLWGFICGVGKVIGRSVECSHYELFMGLYAFHSSFHHCEKAN